MCSSLMGRVYLVDVSAFRERGIYPFIFDPGEHTVVVARDSLREMALGSENCRNYARAINWLKNKVGPLEERTDLFADEYDYRAITINDITLVIFAGTFRHTARFLHECDVGVTLICGHDAKGGARLLSSAMFGLPVETLGAPAPWDGYIKLKVEKLDHALGVDDVLMIDHFGDNLVRSLFGAESTNFRLILDTEDNPEIATAVEDSNLGYVDLLPGGVLAQAYFYHAESETLCDYDDCMQSMSIGCHDHEAYLRYREIIKEADKSWQERLSMNDYYDGGVQFLNAHDAKELMNACGIVGNEAAGYKYSEKAEDDACTKFDNIECYSAIVFENAEQFGYDTLVNLFIAGTTFADRVIFLYHTPRDNYFLPIQQLNRDYAAMNTHFVIDDRVLAQSDAKQQV